MLFRGEWIGEAAKASGFVAGAVATVCHWKDAVCTASSADLMPYFQVVNLHMAFSGSSAAIVSDVEN